MCTHTCTPAHVSTHRDVRHSHQVTSRVLVTITHHATYVVNVIPLCLVDCCCCRCFVVPGPNATCSNRDVRLVRNHENDAVGRVEMCLGGEWLSMCADTEWNDEDARVACRQLGFKNVSGNVQVGL